MWCEECKDYRKVIGLVEEITFRIRCSICKTPRSFGSDRSAAYRAAIKHLINNPTHTMRITSNGKLIEELSDPTDPLPLAEWREANPEHQSSLRELILTKQAEKDIEV